MVSFQTNWLSWGLEALFYSGSTTSKQIRPRWRDWGITYLAPWPQGSTLSIMLFNIDMKLLGEVFWGLGGLGVTSMQITPSYISFPPCSKGTIEVLSIVWEQLWSGFKLKFRSKLGELKGPPDPEGSYADSNPTACSGWCSTPSESADSQTEPHSSWSLSCP